MAVRSRFNPGLIDLSLINANDGRWETRQPFCFISEPKLTSCVVQ
jgi:hypothetical protein